ncbi:MAG: MgtC/SapB family protein [Opitutae bacterium]|nr:MgtC/SapB family protein [Opitutae bacterium]
MLYPANFIPNIFALVAQVAGDNESGADSLATTMATAEKTGGFFDVDPSSLMSPENGWLLLATVCIGGLVGLVRQWHGGEKTTAGMRTFSIWALLGFISAQMESIGFAHFTLAILILLGMSVAVLLAQGGKIRIRADVKTRARFGLTTAGAALVIFCVGALMGIGQEKYAIMLAIVLAAALSLNAWTDKLASSLTGTDVRAGLQFAFLTGILLPLVPNQQVWGIFNPHAIWLMVVLISGVNFVGYIAMRWLGAHAGAALTGLIGGLASSTAVTLSFSKRSRDEPENGGVFAMAILLAQFSMALRLVVLICVLNFAFAIASAPLWGILLGVCALACGALALSHGKLAEGAVPEVKNPLDLRMALKFGALYAIVVFFIERSGNAAGTSFVLVSFLSGIPDTAAVVMSMANQAAETVGDALTADGSIFAGAEASLTFRLAALGAMIGVFSNTLVKLGIAVFLGRGSFRKYAVLGLGCTSLANLAIIVWLFARQ